MGIRVLVVDDEEDFRVIIRDILEASGYEVCLAKDGREALDKAAQARPDAVLADWMMPRMDGQAFVQALRRSQPMRDVPVIMLTVKQAEDDELEALHFGVDDFIVKPFKSEDLLARLRAVLRRAKA
ncbi:MAG: response regulator transcription factor [Elusimicrobia bacterium]|nr:response regulator transcription factor [Elusimicrobiota bacterium]